MQIISQKLNTDERTFKLLI